ncbi:MAG TPA: DUF6569 family protein [Candidatus Angelobacter sp.]|nr:DUF6569 family protein [Candidatus Angelobacter sp.]
MKVAKGAKTSSPTRTIAKTGAKTAKRPVFPKILLTCEILAVAVLVLFAVSLSASGEGVPSADSGYKVLAPISHGDLTIFPVAAGTVHNTSDFLTLDEGLRSAEVVITEVGKAGGMRRRPQASDLSASAEVNRLVLVNNSKRPLILLAGEIVTGGKQDRVVAKDRIVPPESDPIDLGVFCVEPHRWVESSGKFDTHGAVMAQPSLRKQAMVTANQQKVWDEVARSKGAMESVVAAAPPATGYGSGGGMGVRRELESTSSYAKVAENGAVKLQVETVAAPVEKSFESVVKQLRDKNAVGVVVAVKGKIIWADIFADNLLLSRYWPKLVQSYAAESLTMPGSSGETNGEAALKFLDNREARHETAESEPGLYKQTEITGAGFKAFELTSLIPKQSFDLHLSKMAN